MFLEVKFSIYLNRRVFVMEYRNIIKGPGYSWWIFRNISRGRELLWLPVCFTEHYTPYEKWTTLKGSKFLPYRVDLFSEGSKSNLTEQFFLKTLSFSLEFGFWIRAQVLVTNIKSSHR